MNEPVTPEDPHASTIESVKTTTGRLVMYDRENPDAWIMSDTIETL